MGVECARRVTIIMRGASVGWVSSSASGAEALRGWLAAAGWRTRGRAALLAKKTLRACTAVPLLGTLAWLLAGTVERDGGRDTIWARAMQCPTRPGDRAGRAAACGRVHGRPWRRSEHAGRGHLLPLLAVSRGRRRHRLDVVLVRYPLLPETIATSDETEYPSPSPTTIH